jgi:hypothetical protein
MTGREQVTIHPARLQALNHAAARPGRFVLYWMQASCRAEWNHALEHAIFRANEARQPVVACFGLTPGFPEANARHYTFLLEGVRDARAALERRGIPLIVRLGNPDTVAAGLAQEASLVVTDRGYLRIQREWRARAAYSIACPLVQVESDVVVPVESASHKEEYSAATLRPKIRRLLAEFLAPLRRAALRAAPFAESLASLDLSDIPAVVRGLGVDASVPPVSGLSGGHARAKRRLEAFVRGRLSRYHLVRNDPALEAQSGLGPYLHFGQISPLQVALAVKARRGPGPAAASRGGVRDGTPAQQRVPARRARSERLRRRRVVLRQARPAVGGAPGVRNRALYERERPAAEVRHRRLRAQDRRASAPGRPRNDVGMVPAGSSARPGRDVRHPPQPDGTRRPAAQLPACSPVGFASSAGGGGGVTLLPTIDRTPRSCTRCPPWFAAWTSTVVPPR